MSSRSILMLLLRLGVSVGLLIFLFVTIEIDFDELWPNDRNAVVWLVAGLLAVIGSLVLASFRWQQVCHPLGLDISVGRLLTHTLAGQFLSNFVPTTVGGDVLRVRRLGRDTGDPPTAFSTVILERLSGWMVLPGFILFGLALDGQLRELGAATRGALVAAFVTLVALLAIIIAAGNDWTGRFLQRYEGPLRWLHAVHEGLDVMRTKPRQILRILGSGAAYQSLLVLAFWFVSRSIGIEEFGVRAAIAFVPAVLIVQVLPLGIGGLGVREGALVLFLGSLDVPDEQAVALGLSIYAITLLASFLGFPAMAFGGRATDGLGGSEQFDVGADPD